MIFKSLLSTNNNIFKAITLNLYINFQVIAL